MGDNYFAVKGINEDTHGYDFINYEWRGVKETGHKKYEMVRLDGEYGIIAHKTAIENRKVLLPEDCTGTGGISMGAGGWGLSPEMQKTGTKPRRAKKAEKKAKEKGQDAEVLNDEG